MPQNVFLSVGRTSTSEQEEFVKTIERYLESNGLIPQTVGRSVYKNQQPLKAVEECMQNCVGTIIIAFERTNIEHGIEKRGSPSPVILNDTRLPTVWNQIEAAMSYSIGLPLLVLVERGLKNEGLLERGYDWFVKEISLDKAILTESEFIGIFSDWKNSLEKNSDKKKIKKVDVSDLTIFEIFKALKPEHVWKICGAIITLLTGVAFAGYYVGRYFPIAVASN